MERFAGWEIIKLISEGIIKTGQEILAHIGKAEVPIILNISNLHLDAHSPDDNIHYSMSWFIQSKESIYFTII